MDEVNAEKHSETLLHVRTCLCEDRCVDGIARLLVSALSRDTRLSAIN